VDRLLIARQEQTLIKAAEILHEGSGTQLLRDLRSVGVSADQADTLVGWRFRYGDFASVLSASHRLCRTWGDGVPQGEAVAVPFDVAGSERAYVDADVAKRLLSTCHAFWDLPCILAHCWLALHPSSYLVSFLDLQAFVETGTLYAEADEPSQREMRRAEAAKTIRRAAKILTWADLESVASETIEGIERSRAE